MIGGQIKLFRLSASGDEKIIDIIQPGNTFAEALMFMERPKDSRSNAFFRPIGAIIRPYRGGDRVKTGGNTVCEAGG